MNITLKKIMFALSIVLMLVALSLYFLNNDKSSLILTISSLFNCIVFFVAVYKKNN